eukprot:Hpha_TRINITY_DN16023_c7_g1::TRINITY_DN16023_c7_g1_i2::g.120023::m.120023
MRLHILLELGVKLAQLRPERLRAGVSRRSLQCLVDVELRLGSDLGNVWDGRGGGDPSDCLPGLLYGLEQTTVRGPLHSRSLVTRNPFHRLNLRGQGFRERIVVGLLALSNLGKEGTLLREGIFEDRRHVPNLGRNGLAGLHKCQHLVLQPLVVILHRGPSRGRSRGGPAATAAPTAPAGGRVPGHASGVVLLDVRSEGLEDGLPVLDKLDLLIVLALLLGDNLVSVKQTRLRCFLHVRHRWCRHHPRQRADTLSQRLESLSVRTPVMLLRVLRKRPHFLARRPDKLHRLVLRGLLLAHRLLNVVTLRRERRLNKRRSLPHLRTHLFGQRHPWLHLPQDLVKRSNRHRDPSPCPPPWSKSTE